MRFAQSPTVSENALAKTSHLSLLYQRTVLGTAYQHAPETDWNSSWRAGERQKENFFIGYIVNTPPHRSLTRWNDPLRAGGWQSETESQPAIRAA